MTIRTLSVAAVLAFAAVPAMAVPATSPVASISAALDAYRSNHVDDAERMFAAVAADESATEADRAEARRNLGRIGFLVHGKTDALDAAVAHPETGDARCALATTALQTYREAGAPERGLAAADGALSSCTPSGAESLHAQAARAHLAIAATHQDIRAAQLSAAGADVAAIDASGNGSPDVASTRFAVAMAQRNASAAFQAWRDYYWLTDADAPQGMPSYAGRVQSIFATGLAPNASNIDVLALIEMLNRAGFADDSKIFADQTGIATRSANDAAWKKAAAYFAFVAAVHADTLRANHEMADGGKADWYQDAIRTDMNTLMQTMSLSGDPRTVLAENFGLYGTVGTTGGYPSLHGGHLEEDRHISVDQYGHHGELRFVVIDNMLANGYESWLWDGWAQAGGWSGDDGIVQVRSAYTTGPLRSLRRTRPGPDRDRFLAHTADQAAGEHTALGHDGIAALSATSARLDLQADERIAQRTGTDDAAFIAEAWRANNQYSIDIHEGRHAIDHTLGIHDNADLEYRAKLSQIALADYPRLGLANVAAGPINDTPHGIGNRRVLMAYRTWMHRHHADIANFDATQPTLSQLDKLTDAQIVQVVREVDPLARAQHR